MKSLAKRIEENLTTKSGSIKLIHTEALNLIQNPKSTCRPCYRTRSKGYCNLHDSSHNVTSTLDLLRVDYETGNDAPKGGKAGDFIKLTSKGKRQVAKYNSARIKEEIRIEAERKEAIKKEEAKKEQESNEKKEKLAALKIGSPEKIMVDFFANEVHPAPIAVIKAKEILCDSWNSLRSQYKTK